jgi:hypothetical protein
MKINPKIKTFFRIGNESQALKLSQTTEAIFAPDSKYEKLIRDLRAKIVGAGDWLKEEIKSNVDGAKLLVTNPKEAFGGFGRNVAQLVEIAERKLALAQNKSLQPKIEPNIPAVVPENAAVISPIVTPKVPLVQKYPNPLQVDPQNNILPFGQRTKLGIEKGIEIGKYNEIDNTPYFEGRPIIGKKVPKNKRLEGVYPGSIDDNNEFSREILVVDFDKDLALQLFYQKMVDQITLSTGKGLPDIARIYDKLLTPMISLKNSEELRRNHNGKKVQLGLALMEKAVVCRQSALLFATIFERLQQQGIIPLEFECTIERNFDTWGHQKGMHAYCKINTGTRYFIIDPVLSRKSDWLENVAGNYPYAAEGDLSNTLTVGQGVNVLINSGEVEIWSIKSIVEDPNFPNNHRKNLIIVQSGLMSKQVSFDDLRNWKSLTVTPKPPLSIPKIQLVA